MYVKTPASSLSTFYKQKHHKNITKTSQKQKHHKNIAKKSQKSLKKVSKTTEKRRKNENITKNHRRTPTRHRTPTWQSTLPTRHAGSRRGWGPLLTARWLTGKESAHPTMTSRIKQTTYIQVDQKDILRAELTAILRVVQDKVLDPNPLHTLVITPPIAMGFHGMETHGNPHIDSYHGFPRVSRYTWWRCHKTRDGTPLPEWRYERLGLQDICTHKRRISTIVILIAYLTVFRCFTIII